MNFELNDIQKSVQQTFKEFVDNRVMPQAAEIDEKAEFPMELFKEVGELGFFGMRYPEEAGGTNMDIVSYCAAVIELSRGSMSLAAAVTMQSLMATYFLYRFGDKEVRQHFDAALRGEEIGAICMTEPNAGSDLFGIQTKAQVKEDHFLLNGQKTWVTSAPVANFFTVLAKTDNHDKLSIFFVPADLEGVAVGKKIDKLGARGSVTSEVSFDEVKVPKNYLLGEIGGGTKCLLEILAEIRIMTAALSIGVATAAFEYALQYAKEREAFGRPIGKFQAIKMKFADMEVQLQTAKHYVYYAATLSDKNLPRHKESMIAKLYASECSNTICDEASRVLASYGYATEYPLQRYLRDARFTLIGGGTSEILKNNIGRELGL
ncbi:MAG: acyl-CoA dehydrogenase family protein [Flavobacteriales bacterium]|nr:acyl-CoA dehydrogenase family protein [Flavobacteriales bacterium]